MDAASAEPMDLLVPPCALVEFLSLLRKVERRGVLSVADCSRVIETLGVLVRIADSAEDAPWAGYRLAIALGQSDTFDATGYAVAERFGAEFWVSDRRFANAAAGLPGVRYIP